MTFSKDTLDALKTKEEQSVSDCTNAEHNNKNYWRFCYKRYCISYHFIFIPLESNFKLVGSSFSFHRTRLSIVWAKWWISEHLRPTALFRKTAKRWRGRLGAVHDSHVNVSLSPVPFLSLKINFLKKRMVIGVWLGPSLVPQGQLMTSGFPFSIPKPTPSLPAVV